MTIPRIIHTCWFGNAEKPEQLKKLLATQRQILKDYKHIEWNERNFPVDKYPFIKNAYEKRRWAHVSDMARLVVLHEIGGIYLDTDVEAIRPFDQLLDNELFLGYMWDCNLGTAVIGAAPQNTIIRELLVNYLDHDGEAINLDTPNNDLFTRHFIGHLPDFRLDGKIFQHRGVLILSKEYFEHPSFLKSKNYTIHHFNQSWKNNSSLKETIKGAIIKVFGLYVYRKVICYKSLKKSPFYDLYRKSITTS